MSRRFFFAIHFFLGFLLLWLVYTLANLNLMPQDAPLWLKAGLETAYLVAGVIWGNVGWDNFKRFPEQADLSLWAYILSRTLTPVAVALPIFIVALDMFYQGVYVSWRGAWTWGNFWMLILALCVYATQWFYRRSANAFYYSVWRG